MVGALQFEVLMAIVGTEKFSSAIGLVLLVEAIAVLVGPPGAGQSIISNIFLSKQVFFRTGFPLNYLLSPVAGAMGQPYRGHPCFLSQKWFKVGQIFR